MLGILGIILSKIARLKIKFKNAINIGIYAITLPVILNMIYIVVNGLTGFTISNFQWMYTVISYIYVFIAILMIRTDLINRQLQLIKIQEEQQKIREETDWEQDKEDKKEKSDKKQEEEKKEDGEDNNLDEQPDGSQA